jgi:hypothetical protein
MSRILRLALLGVVPAGLLATTALLVTAADESKPKPKHTIKEVMGEAHKKKLLNKVTEGQPTKEDKAKLLDLYLSLWENTPPKGDAASWHQKAGNVIVAAAKVVLEEPGAPAKLKAAVNCAECHKNHKGG